MRLRTLYLAVIAAPILAACATTPKACTPEWVEYKTDRILKGFASDNRGIINDLRKVQKADGELDPFVTIRLLSDTKRLETFADSFTENIVPELQAAVTECGTSDNFVPALTDFLRDEGVSEKALEWVGPIMHLMLDMNKEDA